MAKLHVTIRFEESDHFYKFVAAKPGRQDSDYAGRVRNALRRAPNIGIPVIELSHGPGPGVIIHLEETRETSQPKAKAEIQACLRKKAGYKTFINLPE